MMTKCKKCEWMGYELYEELQRFADKSIHVRGSCPKCKTYIKYVPYSESSTVRFMMREFHRMIKQRDYSHIKSFLELFVVYGDEEDEENEEENTHK